MTLNAFDAVLLGIGLVAVVTGFSSGLLRALATIAAYAIAAPIALAVSPTVVNWLNTRQLVPPDQASIILPLVPVAVLISIAVVLGTLMRGAVGSATGGRRIFIDRLLGALFGAARIGLVAIILVLVFERVIPPGQEPDWLKESALRPYLSAMGAEGLRALPLGAKDYIDKFTRERGL